MTAIDTNRMTLAEVAHLSQRAQLELHGTDDGRCMHRIAIEILDRLNPPLLRVDPLEEAELWQIYNRAQYSGFAYASDDILQLCKFLKILIDEE